MHFSRCGFSQYVLSTTFSLVETPLFHLKATPCHTLVIALFMILSLTIPTSLKRNRFKGPFYSQPYLQGIPAYRYNFAFFLFSRICRCRRNATTFFPLFICLISGCHHQLAPLSSPHLSANFWKLDVAAKYQRARFFRLWTFSQTQLTMEVNPMEVKHNSQKVLETLQYSWPVTPFDSFSCKTCLGTKSSLTLHDFAL